MRIIAGSYKSKKLISPKTDKTRPTLDRVKEALFSIIGNKIIDANVLDLFSGTGNLGLESISRGAKFAWMNDKEKLAISTIISNTKLTNATKYVKITSNDYVKCINKISQLDMQFDIIFLDPPYDALFGINALDIISKNKGKILKDDGIIVYETDKNFISKFQKLKNENNKKVEGIDIERFDDLVCIDTRSYSNVVLKLYNWREI